jgi:hypothetical protein
MRRYRGAVLDLPGAVNHFARNYLLSRYGMVKTAHAIGGEGKPAPGAAPGLEATSDATPGVDATPAAGATAIVEAGRTVDAALAHGAVSAPVGAPRRQRPVRASSN